MLISLNWLDELLSGPTDSRLDAHAVELALTALGLEVEGVEHFGPLEGVVVAEVLEVGPHPNADKLRVVRVADGEGDVSVVCGAPNVPAPGGKVVFAREGAVLPGGFEIGRRKLRGVESRGMICSEEELGIGPDSDGIIVAPSQWTAGTPLCEALRDLVDTVFEISVTPNRPDALGHVGVARDLAVKLGRRLQEPPRMAAEDFEAAPVDDRLVTVVSDARARCGRYRGFALEGARVEASPPWLRLRLHRVGLRPISNVVDVTNYCLMEYAQPMHAFDRARLAEGRVIVRPASPSEAMVTLDGTEIEMDASDLVIADASGPQALAGVMGGEHSMVDEASSELLLEVAYFDPPGVRVTARRHGFHTDSSHRFERGIDWGEGLEQASLRAAWLLAELCDAKLVARHEVRDEAGLPTREPIAFRPGRVGALLGMEVPAEDAREILEALGIDIQGGERGDTHAWRCLPPTHRPDLGLEVDLIEEVMRFHGLEHLPAVPIPRRDRLDASGGATPERTLTEALAHAGFHQIVSLAFEDPAHGARLGATRPVVVDNPLRQQHAWMRTHMLVHLLECAKLNMARHARPLRLFEVGRVYDWHDASERSPQTGEADRRLPRERARGACLWASEELDLPGCVAEALAILARLGLSARAVNGDRFEDELEGAAAWHPGVHARLTVDDPAGGSPRLVGVVGEVHPSLVEAWDLPRGWRLAYLELRLEQWPKRSLRHFEPLPRFPSTDRDVSFDLDLRVDVGALVQAIVGASARAQAGDDPVRLSPGDTSATSVEVVADYRGEGVEPGRRSLTLRLHYRASERSLTEDEVRKVHDALVSAALERARLDDAAARLR